ncbi:MBL fold metallo-hydrolase [soil metagenome]
MCISIASLNSGSNGNCYYVGNDDEAILVDAGISCREIEKRMSQLGLSLNKVKAIFISHEHTDHIKGLPILSKKYQLPVYITEATLFHGRQTIEQQLVFSFQPHQPTVIGNLSIVAFPKHHDASDPCSFTISCNHINVGVFTDIGAPCENLVKHFKECHAAFLEANYDDEMLDKGGYPYYLKKRIRGGLGHLSNKQALQLFMEHKPAQMSHLFLSHLSKNNNCPKLVQELFNTHADGVQMIVASRDEATAVYRIGSFLPQRQLVSAAAQMSFSFA